MTTDDRAGLLVPQWFVREPVDHLDTVISNILMVSAPRTLFLSLRTNRRRMQKPRRPYSAPLLPLGTLVLYNRHHDIREHQKPQTDLYARSDEA